MNKKELKQAFENLYAKLRVIEGNPMGSRSFMYLDILSWLESKISNVPVQQVIAEHFKARAKTDATTSN